MHIPLTYRTNSWVCVVELSLLYLDLHSEKLYTVIVDFIKDNTSVCLGSILNNFCQNKGVVMLDHQACNVNIVRHHL